MENYRKNFKGILQFEKFKMKIKNITPSAHPESLDQQYLK